MDTSAEKLSNLFNTVNGWVIGEIAFVVIVTWALILVIQWLLPLVAEYLPAKMRLVLLNAVPILRLIFLVGALFWLVPLVFNVTVRNFILIMGAVSVALGFAFKDLVSSTIAGAVALFERPYRAGDWVRIGRDYGEVIGVGMRSIRLRTADDDVVTIPHLRLWDDNVSNSNDGSNTLMCVADFYVDPTQDVSEGCSRLEDVARTSAYLDFKRPAFVVSKNLPYATKLSLKAYPFELRDQFHFLSDLSERGRQALEAAGLDLVKFPDMGPATGAGGGRSETSF